jgi:hypothetical protein
MLQILLKFSLILLTLTQKLKNSSFYTLNLHLLSLAYSLYLQSLAIT